LVVLVANEAFAASAPAATSQSSRDADARVFIARLRSHCVRPRTARRARAVARDAVRRRTQQRRCWRQSPWRSVRRGLRLRALRPGRNALAAGHVARQTCRMPSDAGRRHEVDALRALRWPCLCAALAFGCHRLSAGGAPHWREGIESALWLHAAIGFGSQHLDRPSAAMRCLAAAVLPVYMLQMAPMHLACAVVLPLPWSPWLQLLAVVVFTARASFGVHELVVRRVRWLRPLFGLPLAPRGD
jgi:hypothetical protein